MSIYTYTFLQYRKPPQELSRTALCISYKIIHSCKWQTAKGEWTALLQSKVRQAAREPCPPLSSVFSGERRELVMLGRLHGHTHAFLRSLFLSLSPVFFSHCRRAFQMKKLFPWHQTLNLKHTYKQPRTVITMHHFIFILFFFCSALDRDRQSLWNPT